MAELYIIGQIINATEFEEPNLFCKWSIQCGNNLIKYKFKTIITKNIPFKDLPGNLLKESQRAKQQQIEIV